MLSCASILPNGALENSEVKVNADTKYVQQDFANSVIIGFLEYFRYKIKMDFK